MEIVIPNILKVYVQTRRSVEFARILRDLRGSYPDLRVQYNHNGEDEIIFFVYTTAAAKVKYAIDFYRISQAYFLTFYDEDTPEEAVAELEEWYD